MPISRFEDLQKAEPVPSYSSGGNGGYINKPVWGGGVSSGMFTSAREESNWNNDTRYNPQQAYGHVNQMGTQQNRLEAAPPQPFTNGGRSPTAMGGGRGRGGNTNGNRLGSSGSMHLFEPEPLSLLSPSASAASYNNEKYPHQQAPSSSYATSQPSYGSRSQGRGQEGYSNGSGAARSPEDVYYRSGNSMSMQIDTVGGNNKRSNNNNVTSSNANTGREKMNLLSAPQMPESACLSSSAVASLAAELEPIDERLHSLAGHIARLEDLQLAYLADNEKRTQKRIENTINVINKDALEVKALMGKFDQVTQQMAARGIIQQNIIEMRNNQLSNCGKKLVEHTKKAWTLQKEHEKKRTRQAAKRLKVRFAEDVSADGRVGLTDEEAQQMAVRLVQSGNDDQLFLLARDELERAMAAKEQVLAIESEMRELYQMFCDLNVLVVEQGESINEVETMVKSTTRNLEKGNKELKRTKNHQKACAIM